MGHRDKVTAVAFQPQGKVVATGMADGTARLWEAASGRPLSRPIEHRVGITAVAFSPNGTMLLTAGGHTVQKWEVASRKPVGQRLEHPAEVQTAVFSPDGKTIITSFRGVVNGVQFWDAATGKTLGKPWEQSGVLSAVGVCSKWGKIIIGGAADQAQLWNWTTRQPIGPPLKHLGLILAAALNDDGSAALTGSQDHTVRLWNAATGLPIGFPMQHRGPVTCVAFNPVNDVIITGSFGSIRFWGPEHAAGGVRLDKALEHAGEVFAVAFSPRGDRCVTGSFAQENGVIQVWDCGTGRPVGKAVESPHPLSSISFSPDGKFILTAEGEAAVLRDAATGARVGLRLRHAKKVCAAAFSNDGKLVVTGVADGTARVWERRREGRRRPCFNTLIGKPSWPWRSVPMARPWSPAPKPARLGNGAWLLEKPSDRLGNRGARCGRFPSARTARRSPPAVKTNWFGSGMSRPVSPGHSPWGTPHRSMP